MSMQNITVYIAASFRHKHAVRLLGKQLQSYGFEILDWTLKATPPPGLNVAERRIWMDTDIEGGQVFSFCYTACTQAHIVIYFGESGQDAAVEVGLAAGHNIPILGIRGPLEAPGLMLHGVIPVWVEDIEDALALMQNVAHLQNTQDFSCVTDKRVAILSAKLRKNT